MTEQEMDEHAEYYANLRMNLEDAYLWHVGDIEAIAEELKVTVEMAKTMLEAERIGKYAPEQD